jgi:uncharacterized membrane protein
MSKNALYFKDKKQRNLAFYLFLGTIGLVLLVALRWYLLYGTKHFDYMVKHAIIIDRGFSYLFVLINVALAWIPLMISMLMTRINSGQENKFLNIGLFLLWLCFFPNAPYVLTDVIHFDMYKDHVIPKYLHLALLFLSMSVAFLLGMLSFYQVGQIAKQWIKRWAYIFFAGIIFLLSSFGVWLGRFQRWYSWDLLLRPKAFFQGIFQLMQDEAQLNQAILFTLGLSVFMGFSHFLLCKWLKISD